MSIINVGVLLLFPLLSGCAINWQFMTGCEGVCTAQIDANAKAKLREQLR